MAYDDGRAHAGPAAGVLARPGPRRVALRAPHVAGGELQQLLLLLQLQAPVQLQLLVGPAAAAGDAVRGQQVAVLRAHPVRLHRVAPPLDQLRLQHQTTRHMEVEDTKHKTQNTSHRRYKKDFAEMTSGKRLFKTGYLMYVFFLFF